MDTVQHFAVRAALERVDLHAEQDLLLQGKLFCLFLRLFGVDFCDVWVVGPQERSVDRSQTVEGDGDGLVAQTVIVGEPEDPFRIKGGFFGTDPDGCPLPKRFIPRVVGIEIAQSVEIGNKVEQAVAGRLQVADHLGLWVDDPVPGGVIAEQAHTARRDDGGIQVFLQLGYAGYLSVLRSGDAVEQVAVAVEDYDIGTACGRVFCRQDRIPTGRRGGVKITGMTGKGLEPVLFGVIASQDRPAAVLPAGIRHNFRKEERMVAVGHQGAGVVRKRMTIVPSACRVDAHQPAFEPQAAHRSIGIVAQADGVRDFRVAVFALQQQRHRLRVGSPQFALPAPLFRVTRNGRAPVLPAGQAGGPDIGPV